MKNIKGFAFALSISIFVYLFGLLFGLIVSSSNLYILENVSNKTFLWRSIDSLLIIIGASLIYKVFDLIIVKVTSYICQISPFKRFNFYFTFCVAFLMAIVECLIWFDKSYYSSVFMNIIYTFMFIAFARSFTLFPKFEYANQMK